ncbi:hypothetical protein BB559_001644 [Furculomyces boomerangus]|uniref:Dolichyl-diphosphooligosaccharide--protein glycosyltransferase subunit 1 n=1 Tax=Furculomyces boomerangus TaxID=61424 RepID=A0A2T9Z1C0_9FUNG|nr:hypothetical protein BB559_001644 [Furculomyces boomerangus]
MNATIVNTNIIRDIDLSDQTIREKTRIVVLNSPEPDQKRTDINYYDFLVPSPKNEYLGSISASEIKTGKSLKIKKLGENNLSSEIYRITFNETLGPDEKKSIKIEAIYTTKTDFTPKEVSLGEESYYKYSENVYIESMYATLKQKTIFKLPNKNIKKYSDSPAPVVKKDSQVIFGPYKNINKDEKEEVTVLYFDMYPRVRANRYTRTVTVSHWANTLGISENFAIINNSPNIKNFKRSTYAILGYSGKLIHAFTGSKFIIPKDAHNIYFTDAIGNVSTSSIENTPRSKLLVTKARFPIVGGWKYSWDQGYHSYLKNYLKYNKSTNKYNLKTLFSCEFMNSPVRNYELHIILPEGARDIDVNIPFPVDSIEYEKIYSYLDFFGRTKIIIKKKNVVSELSKPILVSYSYSITDMLRKPFIVSAFFFALFLCRITLGRIDYSLKRSKTLKKE